MNHTMVGPAARKLQEFTRTDLNRILSLDPGPNYLAGLLIAIASEGLGRLRDKRDDYIFIEYLMKPHGFSREMAEDVWKALRLGLAHAYETKYIRVKNVTYPLYVGWGAHKHLAVHHGYEGTGLYLNVRNMREDLMRAFDEELADIARTGEENKRVPDRWREKMFAEANPKSIHEWEGFFGAK